MTLQEMEKNVEEVWALFRETDRKFQETDKLLAQRFQGTDRRGLFVIGQSGDAVEILNDAKFSPRIW